MPNKIITGYDGSEGGKAALGEAIKLANDVGGDVTVVFAYEKVVVGGESHDLDEAVEAIGERVLAGVYRHRSGAGRLVTCNCPRARGRRRTHNRVHRRPRSSDAGYRCRARRGALHSCRWQWRSTSEGLGARFDGAKAFGFFTVPGSGRPRAVGASRYCSLRARERGVR